MNIKTISPGVMLVTFPNKKELTFTMCRVEEFYEAASDKLQGKVFTWPEFLDEFLDDKGNIDYFSFWAGFNVPGEVFNEWSYKFRDLSSREFRLIELVSTELSLHGLTDSDKYYVIAAEENNSAVADHEMAHARFYVDAQYKDRMLTLNSQLDADVRKLLIDEFINLGYSQTVFEDEIQAYLSTSSYDYMKNRFNMSVDMYDKNTPAYIEVFSN